MKRLLILALSVICMGSVTGCVAQLSPFSETVSTTTTITTIGSKEESSATELSAKYTTTGLSRQTTLLNSTHTSVVSHSTNTVPSRTTIQTTASSATKSYTTTRTTAITTQRKTQVASPSDYAGKVFDLVNRERAAAALPAVTYRADLQSLADIRVSELAVSFLHTRPNGTPYFTVFTEAEVVYQRVGENIAQGYSTPEAVVNDWMNSAGHRANILGDYNGIVVEYANGYWVLLFIKA